MNTVIPHPFPFNGIIAIVDDDPSITYVLETWLELYDIGVTIHDSAESLLNDVHVNGYDVTVRSMYDVTYVPLLGAVLDVNLPGMTGFELAHILRRFNPALPVTMITALNEAERQAYGTLSDDIRCLTKPFDLNLLEDALFSQILLSEI